MLTIRQYQDADRDSVWFLHNAGLAQYNAHAGNGWWDDDLHNIVEVYLRNRGEFLVAEIGGEVVAMGGLRQKSDDTAEIKRMRVRLDMQQRGIGAELLKRLEERALELGYRTLVLDTTVQQVPAQKLYVKHGFREIRRAVLGGQNSIIFEKHIE